MSQPNPRWTLLTASGVCSLIVLDTNIVAVTLPSIARDLGANFVDIEWVVSAYMLAFAALLLPAGSLTPPKQGGLNMPTVLAITAAVLALGVIGLFIGGYIFKIF